MESEDHHQQQQKQQQQPQQNQQQNPIKRDADSMDDFEHVGSSNLDDNDLNSTSVQLIDVSRAPKNLMDVADQLEKNLLDSTIVDPFVNQGDKILQPVPATPPPSADCEKFDNILTSSSSSAAAVTPADTAMSNAQSLDPFNVFKDQISNPKSATMAFMETERSGFVDNEKHDDDFRVDSSDFDFSKSFNESKDNNVAQSVDKGLKSHVDDKNNKNTLDLHDNDLIGKQTENVFQDDITSQIKSSVLPAPEKPPVMDFLSDELSSNNPDYSSTSISDDISQIIDYSAPTKPLPPLPKEDDLSKSNSPHHLNQPSGNDTGDSEFESEPEPSPAKNPLQLPPKKDTVPEKNPEICDNYCRIPKRDQFIEEIGPKKIFLDRLDAWFNPERLNPKVAALIYWRQPEKSGAVFGIIMALLISLAYFSLISVFSYAGLLTLTFTMGFRLYKNLAQAIQKTPDRHPFKDILEVDLTLPSEKVHEIADIAVAHFNAALSDLRRRLFVEDFIDSIKFGVALWCLTHVGAWFNGMTLIIIGVVAIFTLPKVYETNKAQIDQNLALVQSKYDEICAKIKAATPLSKKAEPAKEE